LGQLNETFTPTGGIDRRAFGEILGPRGERASYAVGWTNDANPAVGRITVGVGVGKPRGGTVHAEVIDDGDSYRFTLVDEPFEDVPRGGPDLIAAQARVHRGLPFIWWVVNIVMARDPRALWMKPG